MCSGFTHGLSFGTELVNKENSMIYILSICLLPSLHRNLNFSMMANFSVWKVAILTLFVAVIKDAAASEEATSWEERYVETYGEQFSALQGIGAPSLRHVGYGFHVLRWSNNSYQSL